ncbi:MAG: nitroreductase family deazaflavin-dependent oxidoreductase [Solirubrobacterales bacterium]
MTHEHDYEQAGVFRRMVRRTAATRPMAWIYARIQQRIDSSVFRLTRGRTTVSSWVSGLQLVMLTTTGAKTGRRRTLPVLGLVEGEEIVVIASNYGRRSNPAWYHNLRAHPRASVTVDGATRDVEALELTGEERERHFQRGVEVYPGFLHYRRWAANRQIPVIRLDPAPRAAQPGATD